MKNMSVQKKYFLTDNITHLGNFIDRSYSDIIGCGLKKSMCIGYVFCGMLDLMTSLQRSLDAMYAR